MTHAKFGGSFIVSDGINISVILTKDRLEAIRVLPIPNCVKEVQTLIGMICQLKSWFPQLSTNIDFLKKLTWKNVAFTWTPDSQALFERLKDHLLKYVPLSPASPDHPFQLYTDRSKTNGIGFILLQEYYGKK